MNTIFRMIKTHGLMDKDQEELDELKRSGAEKLQEGGAHIYVRSLYRSEKLLFFIASRGAEKQLFICSRAELPEKFSGETQEEEGLRLRGAALTPPHARALQRLFPFTAPVSLREKRTTIGCGDRLGLASAAHIRAVRRFNAYPVLAQQSIRELNYTGRRFESIVADAAFLVFQEGYEGGWGADGDHLKTMEDIDTALQAGMPMITLDLTEVLRPEAGRWDEARVEQEFGSLAPEVKEYIDSTYADTRFQAGEVTVSLTKTEAHRCALMYREAMDFAARVDAHIGKQRGEAYDLEISIDETSSPTIPSHHLFIIRELLARGVTVNSLAPRFIGEFQKGIDYIGDLEEFERQFAVHCAIAKAHGGYKISIHSGSDKFSVYPAIGSHTQMRVHLKTAGTSWLEAVRAVARAEPGLYRLMQRKAAEYFPEALKSYHITADISRIPDLDTVEDGELERFLDITESRQMLHITYGGLLNDPAVRDRFFTALRTHEDLHYRIIREHMEKHLRKLGVESA